MILDFRVSNFMTYSDEAEFSLRADPAIGKFGWNVHETRWESDDVLKSACVYGANNSGKTCLVRAFESMKDVLMNALGAAERLEKRVNRFAPDGMCRLGVTFIAGDRKAYGYDFGYASGAGKDGTYGFVYERMCEISCAGGEEVENEIFVRDVRGGKYAFDGDEKLGAMTEGLSTDGILIYSLNTDRYPSVGRCREILREFAGGVDIVDMNAISADRTISLLRGDDSSEREIEKFVECADLDISGIAYLEPDAGKNAGDDALEELRESLRDVPGDAPERIVSYHRGVPVSSVEMDSVGTEKVISLAGHILDALRDGKTLIVDELDAGLHFRLTRAIVLLFDDRLNENGAQLIFTTHDAALLDCERLFREDQIWFVDKDETRAYLYSVADIDDGGNLGEGVFDRYRYGDFGAIPFPDLTPLLPRDEEDKDE